MVRFKIVVPSYNVPDWIGLCLGSLEQQTYQHFDVCVVDDASPDHRHRAIIKEYCQRNEWKWVRHRRRTYQVQSMLDGIASLQCDDDDIVVQLDGDDWLYDEHVLEYVADIYRRENPLMTYGQYIRASNGEVSPRKALRGPIRKQHLFLLPLRTCRYLLWKELRDQDLRGPDGQYLRTSWDMAAFAALAEMAGDRLRFVPRILYVYNDITGLNDSTLRGADQQAMYEYVRQQKPYRPINRRQRGGRSNEALAISSGSYGERRRARRS